LHFETSSSRDLETEAGEERARRGGVDAIRVRHALAVVVHHERVDREDGIAVHDRAAGVAEADAAVPTGLARGELEERVAEHAVRLVERRRRRVAKAVAQGLRLPAAGLEVL